MAVTQDQINECVLSSHGNLKRVRELVEADPELATGNAPWIETPIQAASHMGKVDIAEYLLERGADLDLFAAAMLGRTAVVAKYLHDDPTVATSTGVHGLPSLYFPAVGGHVEISQMLLDAGADVNAGAGGNTALHGAALSGNVSMARWLLDQGADPKATNFEGKTPDVSAAEVGNEEVAEIIRRGTA